MGPWIVNNGFTILYIIIIFCFSLWPPTNHPPAAIMNYSSSFFGATMLFRVFYYLLRARKVYTGPIINVGY